MIMAYVLNALGILEITEYLQSISPFLKQYWAIIRIFIRAHFYQSQDQIFPISETNIFEINSILFKWYFALFDGIAWFIIFLFTAEFLKNVDKVCRR